jgi:heterodisulfide reductase subunit A-like polyferredoxin
MVNQNWRFTTLMIKQFKFCPPLSKDIKCDVLIVGGGMSGISAGVEFLKKGLHVVMIKKILSVEALLVKARDSLHRIGGIQNSQGSICCPWPNG